MNVDVIKGQFSMRCVVEKYGIKVSKKGFCKCPFHQEKTPSMKIYKDSFHCFGCGSSGDIFAFVQKHDNCDFKTAFYSLGGEYPQRDFKIDMSLYRLQKVKEKAEREKVKLICERELRSFFITTIQKALRQVQPMSDAWCYLVNELETELYKFCVLQEEIGRR